MHRQTVNNFHSFNTKIANMPPQQSSINENSFHRVTHESNINLIKNDILHKGVLENITPPTIHPHSSLPLENEMQFLHNLQPCHQQPFSNVAFANANPSVEKSNHI